MALSRSEHSPQHYYSMSAEIQRTRADYYRILGECQHGPLDITPWMEWVLNCLNAAIAAAQATLGAVTAKARFWENLNPTSLHDRQRKALNILLDGLEPNLSSSQWARLTKTSPDSALRDITQLVDRGILQKKPLGGAAPAMDWPRAVNFPVPPPPCRASQCAGVYC